MREGWGKGGSVISRGARMETKVSGWAEKFLGVGDSVVEAVARGLEVIV